MPDAAYRPVLPVLTDENRHFWTSGADGVLRILRCGACGYWLHPPGPRCTRCLSEDLSPQPVSGFGQIESFTINHKAWAAGMTVPYTLVIVGLAEQPDLWLTSRLVDAADTAAAIGMSVEVVFEQVADIWLPLFRPRPAAG